MSSWKQSFENVQANGKLDGAIKLVESFKTDSLEPQNLANYARLLKVLKFLKARFTSLDPELFNLQFFSNIAGPLNNLQSYAQNLVQQNNVTFLQHANNASDQLLEYVRAADSAIAPDAVKAI